MALFQTKNEPVIKTVTPKQTIACRIQQRRYQVLVHSLLYYELNFTLVDDDKWAVWAKELVKLQEDNPEIADKVIFADAFKNFDGSTGFDLPYRDEQIVNIAYRLLNIARSTKMDVKDAIINLQQIPTTPAEYKGFVGKSNTKVAKTRKGPNVDETKRKKLF